MSRSLTALLSVIVMLASAGFAQATIATYDDFTGYLIRTGTSSTSAVTRNNTAETFSITAVDNGKVAIGTSAINGAKVSDFANLKFTNSATVTSASQIVYPNFWVTDKAGHYALIAVNIATKVGAIVTQDDVPVYGAMTSAGGMVASYFEDLAIRAYATNASDLNWLYSGAKRVKKFSGWDQSLWKSADTSVFDPVRISDLGNLYFGSPFTTTTVPGVAGNSQWTYVGTGDPQTPNSLYLMCGDTSGSVQNYNYTLGDIALEWGSSNETNDTTPEPASLAVWSLLAMAGIGLRRRTRK
jgi:hypothetical protein